MLMLGRELNLPLDEMVGCPDIVDREYECTTEYIEWLQNTVF